MEMSIRRLAAVLYVSVLAWTPAFFIQYDILAWITRFQLGEEVAGWMASAQLLVLTGSAMFFSRWIARVDKRWSSFIGCAVGVIANLGAFWFDHAQTVFAFKMLYGVAVGLLVASSYGLIPLFRHPEKIAAKVGMTMALLFGVVMLLIPAFMERNGASSMDLVHLGLMLAGAAVAPLLPRACIKVEAVSGQSSRRLPKGVKPILLALLTLFASQIAALGFAAVVGTQLGIAEQDLAVAFMLSAFAMLPGAFLVELVGDRLGYFRPLLGALLLLIAAYTAMYCLDDAYLFLAGLLLINVGAMMANPYLIATIAKLDVTGRSAAIAGSITNLGMASGPALAGAVFAAWGHEAVGLLSVLLIVVAIYAVSIVWRKSLVLDAVRTHPEMQ